MLRYRQSPVCVPKSSFDDPTKPTIIGMRGGIGLLSPLRVTRCSADASVASSLLLYAPTGLEMSPAFHLIINFQPAFIVNHVSRYWWLHLLMLKTS